MSASTGYRELTSEEIKELKNGDTVYISSIHPDSMEPLECRAEISSTQLFSRIVSVDKPEDWWACDNLLSPDSYFKLYCNKICDPRDNKEVGVQNNNGEPLLRGQVVSPEQVLPTTVAVPVPIDDCRDCPRHQWYDLARKHPDPPPPNIALICVKEKRLIHLGVRNGGYPIPAWCPYRQVERGEKG